MLKITKTYKVKSFNKQTDTNYRRKLIVMGMLPNPIFRVIRYAPLGETVQIEVSGFTLALRSRELQSLNIEEYLI